MKKAPVKTEPFMDNLLKHRFDGKPLVFPVTVNLRVEPPTAALLIEAAWRLKITVPEAAEKIIDEIEVMHDTVAEFVNQLKQAQ